MVIYWSRIPCSFKLTFVTKIIIWNSVVTICACIDLFHIFIQTSKNIFLRLKDLSLYEIVKVIQFSKINIQTRKLVYDITKSRKINIIQDILSFYIPINMCSFFWLCFFHTLFLDNCATTWILSIIHETRFFLTNYFGNNFNCFPGRLNSDVKVEWGSWFNLKFL